HYYSVEARRRVGYDVKLPGAGVIIHEVDTTRGTPAHVLDIDENEDTGDAGAIWSTRELFADPTNQIYVCVNSEAADGYDVTAGRGLVPACAANPTPTNTPRPGNVLATNAVVKDYSDRLLTILYPEDHMRLYGDYVNSSGVTQTVRMDWDITGPCGPIFHTHVREHSAL